MEKDPGEMVNQAGNPDFIISVKGGPWELYDMQTDRTEPNNIAAELPEKVKELSTLYDVWSAQCSATTKNRQAKLKEG